MIRYDNYLELRRLAAAEGAFELESHRRRRVVSWVVSEPRTDVQRGVSSGRGGWRVCAIASRREMYRGVTWISHERDCGVEISKVGRRRGRRASPV